MFKKVLQSISKSLSKQTEPVKAATAAKITPPAAATTPPTAAKATASGKNAVAAAPATVAPPKSVEDQLGIEAKMTKEQIREQLKLLYRRYNRAASSLDNATRAEADSMLDAIVAVREKHFGEI